jgi:DNA mismatch repair ATPase MutS
MPTESLYVLFAKDKDERWTTEYLGQILGDAEVLYCLAKDKRFKKPIWVPHTYLQIHGFHDISILENPKLSSVKFTQDNSHSLLTGPNRGGKSSNLRGILQNVLWAQTYGVAPCSLYKGSLFKWILSSLRVEDRPGTSSLFEREIEIATTILKQARTEGRGLVLIDEIFHSTNPPDGEKSARIFLEQLWEHPNIVSCVSTHVYSIVEDSPEHIQKICSFARKNEDDSITYEYTLRSGICKVSSVDDVLREKELLRPCAQSL